MRFMMVLAAVLALASAAPAAAQEAPRTARFSVGSVRLLVELPKGYCVADEALFNATQGRVDKGMNVTHLLIVKCGAHTLVEDFYAIKTPVSALDVEITRAGLFAEMKPVFDAPEMADRVAAVAAQASARTAAQGSRVDFKGAIKPFGMDETCAYLGGLVTVQEAGVSLDIAQGTCMTSVGGRLVVIYSTGRGSSPEDLQRHIRASKALALTMRPAPDK